ncbi:MAG: hypothetical protein F6K22_21740 [Okeania sp. SIO2F4]|uniref:hypothetical protein n=1 Tax=Okeania sp. SIO2F4 TaxID=2607790 RepID=UPI00142C7D9A|nr:hypothetical protein [Okeania sp. SIO2F4]NES05210.1 hypothetical protein [Okeania sp. SIO2F4]
MNNKINGIFPHISPGDVIAFSGNGLDAKIIRSFTRSPYSHVAIVLETECLNKQCQDILIAESTAYTVLPDFKEQKRLKGVQVHWLSHWLDIYKTCGQAWWFPLNKKLSYDRIAQMQSWLWHLNDRHTPYAFCKSIGSWLAQNKYFNAETKGKSPNASAGFFCSELVAEALQIAGTIDPKLNPAAHTPKDLMNIECFQEPMLILP